VFEPHSKALRVAPNYVAGIFFATRDNVEHEFMRDSAGTDDLNSRTHARNISNGAIHPSTSELKPTGLENPLPRYCAFFDHFRRIPSRDLAIPNRERELPALGARIH
jgi:hypothetical protein